MDPFDIMSLISKFSIAIGSLAVIVSVITQVIKEVSFLAKIPTQIVVIVISLILTPLTMLAYNSAAQLEVKWYMTAGSVVGGFFVAFIAMHGWERLKEIVTRLKSPE